MTKSAVIQEFILDCLSDGLNHNVQEIKRYLAQKGVIEYSEGQFAGSLNTLQRSGSIIKIDRGIYAIGANRVLIMDKSDVIQYHQMMIPSLKALQTLGGSANIGELDLKAIDIMQLSEEMRNVLHKEDGTLTEVEYRLAWARTYLKKYGLIENSSRGVWSFTETFDGNVDALSADEIVKKVREMSRKKVISTVEDDDFENDGVDIPEEAMDWRERLRNVMMKTSTDAFERLTLRLLRESGFTQVEITGKSGDQGIDGKGVIRLHGIMSFHMIFKCKRHKGSVTPSEIRDFRGTMQGRADKGLFITTGSFTSEAKKEAVRDGAPAIDLIDGDSFIERLKDLGLGVTEKIIKDYEVNEEWFMRI